LTKGGNRGIHHSWYPNFLNKLQGQDTRRPRLTGATGGSVIFTKNAIKAIIIDQDNYLLELTRYVQSNPIRISVSVLSTLLSTVIYCELRFGPPDIVDLII